MTHTHPERQNNGYLHSDERNTTVKTILTSISPERSEIKQGYPFSWLWVHHQCKGIHCHGSKFTINARILTLTNQRSPSLQRYLLLMLLVHHQCKDTHSNCSKFTINARIFTFTTPNSSTRVVKEDKEAEVKPCKLEMLKQSCFNSQTQWSM